MGVTIKLRGGTAAEWTAANPILADREIGLETDTQKYKVGDGVTAWGSLPYWTDAQAPAGHDHDADYSPTGHTHPYSPDTHNHDADYSPTGHTHPYSPDTHNHDADYSPTGHTHPYSPDTHNHDADYAASGHTHPYSPDTHNHDADYAASGHNHDSRYYTESEVDSALAGKSDTGHTHGPSGGAEVIILQDQKSSGTNGGTFNSGAWRTRDLNTIVRDDTGAVALSSNQITLPAGTYYILAVAPAYRAKRHQARLYNVDDAIVAVSGHSEYSDDVNLVSNLASVIGTFTISSSKKFELQHRCQSSYASIGFGISSGASFTVSHETFSEIILWRT